MKKDFTLNEVNGQKHERAFTLIELLVVIAIIAILSSPLMVNFIGIRQRGRDAQRKSNLFNIQTALGLYYSDNSSYPATLDCDVPLQSPNSDSPTVYMQKIPCDPSTHSAYKYIASPDGSTYSIYACLENTNDSDADTNLSDVTESGCSTSTVPFKVTNP